MAYTSLPCCNRCWYDRHPDTMPVRISGIEYKGDEQETCGYCGGSTRSGIFVRERIMRIPPLHGQIETQ